MAIFDIQTELSQQEAAALSSQLRTKCVLRGQRSMVETGLLYPMPQQGALFNDQWR